MGSKAVIDLECFPVVVLTFPESFDDADMDGFYRVHEQMLRRRERYVSISDFSRVRAMPKATDRQRLAEWAKNEEPRFKQFQVANALVFTSPMLRAGLQAVHWLAPPPVPTAVVGTVAEGIDFLEKELRRVGLPVFPQLLKLRDALVPGATAR